MHPKHHQDWIVLADQRMRDAEALLQHRPESTAASYLAGYAVENSLKAYLLLQGEKRTGHDLRSLTRDAQLRFKSQPAQGWFLDQWTVHWRYIPDIDTLPHPPNNVSKPLAEYTDMYVRSIGAKSKNRLGGSVHEPRRT